MTRYLLPLLPVEFRKKDVALDVCMHFSGNQFLDQGQGFVENLCAANNADHGFVMARLKRLVQGAEDFCTHHCFLRIPADHDVASAGQRAT